MENVIGELSKSSTSKIQITKKDYKGKFYIDTRNWFKSGEKWYPTTKGIMISTDNLSQYIDLLEQAEKAEKTNG